ncbi:hypothetical protein F4808DRAFT_137595 [Astrocystis sublimbata]|nr:hypothetical protein F4808DRAFT_137595 [Astrocystis sublimbata]
MWLLKTENIESLEMVEVHEEPPVTDYAILSHTWGSEEVTFEDAQTLRQIDWSQGLSPPSSQTTSQVAAAIRRKKGFGKIRGTAAVAAQMGYKFIWIDTCCIDKKSSAELSEAINSMYRWYQKASICLAYLEDAKQNGPHTSFSEYRHSRWFSRGWTLQELIAPTNVLFYDRDWQLLGSKVNDENVRKSLAQITGIDIRVLKGLLQPSDINVATRMRWASQRETTRLEDRAYSLMGLFDINMPLLYGEGKKAFIRLQEEILKTSNDYSIFAWKTSKPESAETLSGLLAESPHHFCDVEEYRLLPPSRSTSAPWRLTNQGLELSLPLTGEEKGECQAILGCTIRDNDNTYMSPAIQMRRLYGDQYVRVNRHELGHVKSPYFDSQVHCEEQHMFVKQSPSYTFIDIVATSSMHCHITEAWPEESWDEDLGMLRTKLLDNNRINGLFRFYAPSTDSVLDFAIGFSNTDMNWSRWYLQRPSLLEPLDQAVSSVNEYLASLALKTSKSAQTATTPDWLANPWREDDDNLQIRVDVDTIDNHGRHPESLKASAAFEIAFELSKSDIVGMLNGHEINQLKDLIDFTIPNHIESYLDSHGFWSKLKMPKVRVPSGQSLELKLEDLVVEGIGFLQTRMLRDCKDGCLEDVSFGIIWGGIECITEKSWSSSRGTNTPWFNGFRPIHWAVIGGHLNVVRTLLNRGANFFSRTAQGWSVIHLAALLGRFILMKWLINYAASVLKVLPESLLGDACNIPCETPVDIAILHINSTAEDESQALVEILAKVHSPAIWTTKNIIGETPLHRLAASGAVNSASKELSVIQELPLDCFQHRDLCGRTTLWHAVCSGSVAEVRYHIKHHTTHLTDSDNGNMSPLHVACYLGYADIAEALLSAGADPNTVTKGPGLTAAHLAAIQNHISCLAVLIKYKAHIHQINYGMAFDYRPIHVALANKYLHFGRVLCDNGADMEWTCTGVPIKKSEDLVVLESCNKSARQLLDEAQEVVAQEEVQEETTRNRLKTRISNLIRRGPMEPKAQPRR